METVLIFDRVVLVKELNDKMKKLGEVFEIANIVDGSFVLRNTKTRAAVGVVNFEDFDKHFVKEGEFKGWTKWMPFVGLERTDAFYRTNRHKIEVKFVTDKVRATACCHKDDEFNLSFGVQLAYYRCEQKSLLKQRAKYKEEIKRINQEIADYNLDISEMIKTLND